ncbi:MAG: site-specific DNA-methyltransferase [Rhodobacteraceae bacterium]|nr:site-specific DNA-methyltransferase [Paracoccaceae bacterium]
MTVKILVGDCLEKLAELPAESVHCVVTSPPYWGLRSYHGEDRMIGLESTFAAHLENIVAVFREVRRVMREDGTLWMNYGDAYAGSGKGGYCGNSPKQASNVGSLRGDDGAWKSTGLKPKDLMMMPARVAIALQADGWWLRSEIIWHKPNPMPESVTDRPVTAHEKVFLFAKSRKYYYDAVAVRTGTADSTLARYGGEGVSPNFRGGTFGVDEKKLPHNFSGRVPAGWASGAGYKGQDARHNVREKTTYSAGEKREVPPGAHLRNVWKIPTAPYRGAHFATFPPALVEPCVKAGTSEHGVCPECGSPWKRVVAKSESPHDGKTESAYEVGSNAHRMSLARQAARERGGEYQQTISTTGWEQTCGCAPHEPVPATVLDPFGGSGTTALVADRLHRDAILIEISEEYASIARKRVGEDAPLFSEVG